MAAMLTITARLAPVLLFLIALLPWPAAAGLVKVETATALRGVYLIPDAESNTVRVSAVFLAGEADSDAPEGLAHYVEHLMFWHADRVSSRAFHSRGGNAWINGIITTYYNEGPTTELDDLFAFAGRLLTPLSLDASFMRDERRIVAREYDLRISENPKRRFREQMNRTLYGANPVGRSVIGTPQTIDAFDLDMAERFRQRHYVAANMVLLASGNLSEDTLRRKVEDVFGDVRRGAANAQGWRDAALLDDLSRTIDATDSRIVSSAYQFSSLSHWTGSGDRLQDMYTIGFLAELLGSSLPGGLAKPLTINDFVVSTFHVRLDWKLRDQIQFYFQARPDEGVAPETVAAKLHESLVALADSGVPERSVERIRKRFTQEAARRGEEPDHILGRAMRNLTAGLDPNDPADHLQRIATVTKADIDRLIRAVTDRHRYVEVNLTQEGS